MKILFISLFLPQQKATHAGGRYVFEIIKNMSQWHDIYLATRVEASEINLLDNLRPYCKEIYPHVYPAIEVEKRGVIDNIKIILSYIEFSYNASKLIRGGNFDIVQVEWVETAIMIRKNRIPMILDAHDVITKPAERALKQSIGLMRLLAWIKYILIKHMELRIIRKFNMIIALSEYDRNYLLNLQPDLSVKTVPIPAGLDITDRIFKRQGNTILFLASYKYHQTNVDAAHYFYKEVLPLIRKVVPDALFVIAGYGPPEELKKIPEADPRVIVTGFVDDLDECYKQAAVFVAPILTGGGIIVKILDALAAGTPVVTTTYGNEGIAALPGRDILVADDPKSFADAVLKLLTDKIFAEKLAANGKEFVKKNYGLESVVNKWEEAYKEVL